MGKVIGIDLGTTNSCVAFCDGKTTTVISNKGGYKTTPSVVAILENNRHLVGQVAKRQAITNPKSTVYSVKRLIGRRFNSREASVAKAIYPYEIVEGENGDIRIQCLEKRFSVPEISSYILLEMKRVAETQLQETVQDAVITVPAYFNDGQRQATKDAGHIAGLNVLRIINEPTAAAIAYGYNKRNNKNIAVYDLGGGTFDISILEINDGVFKVLATAGDTFLGGDDFDNLLIDHLAEKFLQQTEVDLRQHRMALQRLRDTCEKAKCDLSSYHEIEINLPFIHDAGKGPLHLNLTITRKELERLTGNLVQRTLATTEECLKLSGLSKEDLDDVLLVGGQTRMPMVQDTVSNFFGRSASKQVHPDEAVAIGAAIQAHALTSESKVEMLLLDVTPLSLGIASAGSSFTRVIQANTTVPVSQKKIFTTVSDNQKTVRIQVFQGEAPVATDNELLGEFLLDGIRKAKAGEPEIEVSFDIDSNGIVHVSAKDLFTKKEQSITVTMSSGLSQEEIEKARSARETLEVALKDQEENEALAQKTEVLAHRLKKVFDAKKETLSSDQQKKVTSMIEQSASVIEQKDVKRLTTLTDELQKKLKEIE